MLQGGTPLLWMLGITGRCVEAPRRHSPDDPVVQNVMTDESPSWWGWVTVGPWGCWWSTTVYHCLVFWLPFWSETSHQALSTLDSSESYLKRLSETWGYEQCMRSKEFGISLALFPCLWLAGAWKEHIVAQSCSRANKVQHPWCSPSVLWRINSVNSS